MCGSVGARIETDGAAGQDPQGLGAVLVAALEQQLEAEADAQERAIGVDPGPDRLEEAALAKPVHRRSGRADARDHQEVRVVDVVAGRRAADAGSGGRERLLDRHQVAGAVVHDDDARRIRARHPSDPFVEATPVRRGSGSHAIRSARPSALNAASAR